METSNEAKGLSETKSSDTVIDLKAHVDSTDSDQNAGSGSSQQETKKVAIKEIEKKPLSKGTTDGLDSVKEALLAISKSVGMEIEENLLTKAQTESLKRITESMENNEEILLSKAETVPVEKNEEKLLSKVETVPIEKSEEELLAKIATDTVKFKPPPLEVTSAPSAPESHFSAMGGPKTPTSATAKGQLDRRKLKERKIGHRRVDEEGQITFKKIQTSQIMGSIQLGIGHAVGSLASKPERDLLMQDFTIVETTSFPKDGSSMTPAHHYSDFKFKSYAPVAFRYFRDLFGIQPDDYLLSLCNYPMRELTNPGASGSIFYLTDDGEFIIKTVMHREAEFLQKLLPGYYMNLNENPRTLLPKYFGLYCYICGGKNIRLAVMNNLLPTTIKIHEKYDLKGSTYKRKASKQERKKSSPTYKDLDFMERHPDGIYLEPETYNALTKTISRDCRVLESFKIMDYSLLVGIHNVDLAKKEKLEEKRKEEEAFEPGNGRMSDDSESASPIQVTSTKSDTALVRSKSINRQRLTAFSTAMESIQAEIEVADEDEDVPPGGIPAKNAKGENVLLFLGIIDILQSFRLKKKLEHAWKSVLHDGDTVSVHRPGFYAQRFQDFMGKTVFRKAPGQHRKFKTMVTSVLALKHSPSKRKGVTSKPQPRPSATSESEASRSYLPKIPSESECTQEEVSSEPAPSSSHSNYPEVESSASGYDADSKTYLLGESHSSWSSRGRGAQGKPRSNTDPPSRIASLRSGAVGKTSSVTWDRTDVSLSQVTIQTESTADCVSETSSSSTSGLGSTLHTVTWTPPHSVEGSTPTHTEGTPSFTESSSSGDAACPTTPVKSINKSLDSLPPLGETQILQGSEMIKRF